MSDSSHPFDFGKFIPGFDFLQNLAAGGQGAAAPSPSLHHWVAPTVSVEELDKRIAELKAVLFWLEQNGAALKATIQALEVQKMTLATLAGMNLSLAEVAKAFTLPTPPAPQPAAAPAPAPGHWPFAAAPAPVAEPSPEPAPAAPGLADPLQWWGALTQQFQQIAASALGEAPQPVPPAVKDATDFIAASARPAGVGGKKGSKSSAAAKAPAKKADRSASARKAAARPAAARKKPARPPAGGDWPLPPPARPGR